MLYIAYTNALNAYIYLQFSLKALKIANQLSTLESNSSVINILVQILVKTSINFVDVIKTFAFFSFVKGLQVDDEDNSLAITIHPDGTRGGRSSSDSSGNLIFKSRNGLVLLMVITQIK